jgi:RNA polymerase sigma-70 factor (ECF subfamily)
MERHRGIVFKLVHAYAPSAHEHDDLGQEIYAEVWKSFARYDPERRFSTWLYRVGLNVAISYVRRANTRNRYAAELADMDELAGRATDTEEDPRVELLHGFIRKLDELNRALLLLYLEDYSHQEIAEILGISVTNVSTRLNRLRDRMRQDLVSEAADSRSPVKG